MRRSDSFAFLFEDPEAERFRQPVSAGRALEERTRGLGGGDGDQSGAAHGVRERRKPLPQERADGIRHGQRLGAARRQPGTRDLDCKERIAAREVVQLQQPAVERARQSSVTRSTPSESGPPTAP